MWSSWARHEAVDRRASRNIPHPKTRGRVFRPQPEAPGTGSASHPAAYGPFDEHRSESSAPLPLVFLNAPPNSSSCPCSCASLTPGPFASRIKNKDRGIGIKVLKHNDANLLRSLESSIRAGIPVLLENVSENLDPALNMLLQKQTFQQNGRTLLKLGDTDVEYDPRFNLYMTTRLANPHFSPEHHMHTTVMTFEV